MRMYYRPLLAFCICFIVGLGIVQVFFSPKDTANAHLQQILDSNAQRLVPYFENTATASFLPAMCPASWTRFSRTPEQP